MGFSRLCAATLLAPSLLAAAAPAFSAPGILELPAKGIRLEVRQYRSFAWGTSVTFGPPPVGVPAYGQAIILRYFPSNSTAPGTAPITIDASPNPNFSDIYKTKQFTPVKGVMDVTAGLALGPFAGPGAYTGAITHWYLRARIGHAPVSNTVALTYPSMKK